MCDYSLEMYRTIPAKIGVSYPLVLFGSGSAGFTTDEDASRAHRPAFDACAVCMPEGAILRLEGLPEGVPPQATMVRLSQAGHRDAIKLMNGEIVPLGALFGRGIRATVIMLADKKAPEDRDLASPPAERPVEVRATDLSPRWVSAFEPTPIRYVNMATQPVRQRGDRVRRVLTSWLA